MRKIALPLLCVGLCIGALAIVFATAETKETKYVSAGSSPTITISDDFTTIPNDGVQLSNDNIKYGNAIKDSNILAYGNSWQGAFPSTNNTVTTSFITSNGYLIYKLSSGKSGTYLKNASLTLKFGITTSGIYNNPFFSSSMGKANLTVEVSDDGEVYESIYNFLEDKSMYHNDQNPYYASNTNVGLEKHYEDTKTIIYSDYLQHGFVTYIPTISLADYVAEDLYIKINLINCKPSEIKASSSTLQAKDIGERLYKVNLTASTTQTIEAEGSYFVFDNFRDNSQKMGNLKGHFTNLRTDSSVAHGLIPSYEWGASVNCNNGYALYEIPVNGNGFFSTFTSLSFKMNYLLTGNNNSNIQLYAGFKMDKLEKIYDVKQSKSTSTSASSLSIGLTEIANGTTKIKDLSAKENETLYLQINVLHDKGLFSLGNIGAKIFDITLKGKMNFCVLSDISLKYGSNDSGLRFATLVNQKVCEDLVNQGYKLTYGSLVMPYDYIATYGDLNYKNVFSNERVYSTNDEENGIHINLSYAMPSEYNSKFNAIYSTLSNIKQENLARNFVSRGIIIVEKNNETKYLFASYSNGDVNNNKVNIYDAATQIINETSDYYLKRELKEKYIDKVGDVISKYTQIDVYFYKDGTTYMVTKRTCYNLVGTEVEIKLDPQASGSIVEGGVMLGGKFYKYFDELPSLTGITHYSNIKGTIRADGKLTLIRFYKETTL